MDAELNTNVQLFGADLQGYPRVQQSNTYNDKVTIPDEAEKTNYQRMPTDDLSFIWKSNHRDNLDDLDTVLQAADPQALDRNYDVDYHGARNLNPVATASRDMWDFSRFLAPETFVGQVPLLERGHIEGILGMDNMVGMPGNLPRQYIDGMQNLPRQYIDGMQNLPRQHIDGMQNLPRQHIEGLDTLDMSAATPSASESSAAFQTDSCFPMWAMMLIIVVVMFGACGIGYFIGKTPCTTESVDQSTPGVERTSE